MDLMRVNNLKTMLECFDSIPEYMLTGYISKNTAISYLTDIKQFFKVKDERSITISMLQNVNTVQANLFATELMKKGYKKTSINRKMESLSSFYDFLSRKDINIVDSNPFSKKSGAIRFKANDFVQARVLQGQEIKAMLSVYSDKNNPQHLRNNLMILLLALTGIRRNELRNILLKDIGTMDGHYIIFIRKAKGNKERFVEIPYKVFKMINEYLTLCNLDFSMKEQPLFFSFSNNGNINELISNRSINRIIKDIAIKSGIDEELVSPHSFRQTYVTKSRQMGQSLEDIAQRVGHESINTTKRYDHSINILKNNPVNQMFEEII